MTPKTITSAAAVKVSSAAAAGAALGGPSRRPHGAALEVARELVGVAETQ